MQHSSVLDCVNPFSLKVDPEAAIAHPAWQRARTTALDVLRSGGQAVLLGPPGSGKSLLLRELARTLRGTGAEVRLVCHTDEFEAVAVGEAVLVDEADAVEDGVLAGVLGGAGPVLLAGLPGLAARLPGGPAGVRRIVLDRLSPEDVARFVVARLAAAGRPGLLTPEAILALARASDGLPRMVNTLGAAAVFLAGVEGSAQVDRHHVEEAVALRDEPIEPVSVAELAPMLPVEQPAVAPVLVAGGRAEALHRGGRGALVRRRAALAGIVALTGGVALSWVLPGRRGAPALGGAGQGGVPEPLEVRGPLDGGGTPAGPAQQTQPPVRVLAPSEAAPASSLANGEHTAVASDTPALFRGPIFNETMGQGGRVVLAISRQEANGAIRARFEASQGLSGSGVLSGKLSGAGRLTASGQLSMGKGAFMCDLAGTLDGNTLVGSANFVRVGTGATYHSRFSLVRA